MEQKADFLDRVDTRRPIRVVEFLRQNQTVAALLKRCLREVPEPYSCPLSRGDKNLPRYWLEWIVINAAVGARSRTSPASEKREVRE